MEPISTVVYSRQGLEKLAESLDELGITVNYSSDRGWLEFRIGDAWIDVQLDGDVMKDEVRDQFWLEDSYQIAEGLWRQ